MSDLDLATKAGLMHQAAKLDLSAGALRAYAALLFEFHRTKSGHCAVTYEQLADDVGLSVRTIMRAVLELEEHTLVAANRIENGGRSAKTTVTVLSVFPDEKGDNLVTLNGHSGHEKGDNLVTPTLYPCIKRKTMKTPMRDRALVDDAFTAYTRLAEELGIPSPKMPTDGRLSKIQARVKEHGFEAWLLALDEIRASAFLSGATDSNWRVTLDWLVKPDNFNKVIEGNYRGRRGVAGARPNPKSLIAGCFEGSEP